MATGGGYPSFTDASEETFDSECFNCSQDGKHVKAEVYCVECGDNFCRDCINVHNKMARNKTHQISAVIPGTTQGVQNPPTEKCLQHHGKLINTYCRTHDVVCCSVCVSLHHATCTDKSYIPTIAKGTSSSKELQDTNKATQTIQQKLDSLQEMKRKYLKTIRAAQDDSLTRTKLHKEKMIKYIEMLEESTVAEIVEQYRILEDAVRDDLDELSKLITALEQTQNQLRRSMNNESKLFVHLKQCKEALSASEKLIRDRKCETEIPVTFEIDDSVEKFLNDRTSLGSFVDKEFYSSAVHLSDENINSPADTFTCHITGICSLDDGGLIIADFDNTCLKKLDQNVQIQGRCALPGNPWDVCQTSSSELAVSIFYDKKIQFVSVGQALSLTRSFSTSGDGNCVGIAYRDGRLYVGRRSPGSVQVYNVSGSLLQTIQNDQAGTSIFRTPAHIAVSATSSNIIIADYRKGLVTLDKSGRLLTQITDQDLKGTFGVCALPGDQLLVCGWNSNNVIQFDVQGKKVRTLLTSADGLNQPETLHFDTRLSRLLVGMAGNDKIKVFRLMRK